MPLGLAGLQHSALDPRSQFSCLTVALRAVAEPQGLASRQPALLDGLLRLLGALAASPATADPVLQVRMSTKTQSCRIFHGPAASLGCSEWC